MLVLYLFWVCIQPLSSSLLSGETGKIWIFNIIQYYSLFLIFNVFNIFNIRLLSPSLLSGEVGKIQIFNIILSIINILNILIFNCYHRLFYQERLARFEYSISFIILHICSTFSIFSIFQYLIVIIFSSIRRDWRDPDRMVIRTSRLSRSKNSNRKWFPIQFCIAWHSI